MPLLKEIPSARLLLRLAVVSLLATVFAPAVAQSTVSHYHEHSKLMRAPQALGVLGDNLMGDKVNFYTGSLEFVQSDVSLPGNSSLPVAMGRRMATGPQLAAKKHFGNWDMEIPRLHGIFAEGWNTGLGTDRTKRCSVFGAPKDERSDYGGNGAFFRAQEFWHGNFLYVPGTGDQEMLRRSHDNSIAPNNAPSDYPVVTRNNWQFSCIALASGGVGEGFLALAPDGTTYRFDWMVTRAASRLEKTSVGPDPTTAKVVSAQGWAMPETTVKKGGKKPPGETPSPMLYGPGYILDRSEIWILPTVVTDRYGNSVTYSYDTTNKWQLKTIKSLEGGSPRTLTLTYASDSSPLVSSVSDGSRTWRYTYINETTETAVLSTVTLPDNSKWELAGLSSPGFRPEQVPPNCQESGPLADSSESINLTHPSGAMGAFTLTATRHGRTGVTNECFMDGQYQFNIPKFPKEFDNHALTKKVLSGPGLTTLEWNTTYPTPFSSWGPCNGCDVAKVVEVTNPSGAKTRYAFGTQFRATEGELQSTTVLDSDNTVLRTTTQRYAEPVTPRGFSQQGRGDGDFGARVREMDQRITTQQGVDFTWEVPAFNAFAQATRINRYSSLSSSMSRSELMEYANNERTWILGQLSKITETSTGKVTAENTYDPVTGSLLTVQKFGKLDQTLTYNTDGTLASRKDGLNQITKFSDYKRGVPRSVTYANNTFESAAVDDMGLITSTTNAASFTTTYGYDVMGRLARITLPVTGPEVWNPTTITYLQSADSKLDLSPGHWRQEVKTGNNFSFTYYDALFRPVYVEQWDNADKAGTNKIVKFQHDFAGRKTFESYPRRVESAIGDGAKYFFDGLGRPTLTEIDSELGKLSTATSYEIGFIKRMTDPRSNVVKTSYQAFDEPSESAIAEVELPKNIFIKIDRDVFGKTTAITRRGYQKSAKRSYVYDTFARLCKTIEPETGATVQSYDAANNVAWRATGMLLPSESECDYASVPAASKMTFGYDVLNRLKSTKFGDGSPEITRTYTSDGLADTVSTDVSVWTNAYNNRRLNTQEKLAYGGTNYVIGRQYDANGSLKQLAYPANSLTVDYSPNALGQPSKVGTFATGITYHPSGAIAAFKYGNGVVHSMIQNERGLPKQTSDAGVISDLYSYDANGNVLGISDLQNGSSSRTMAYDELDRLRQADAPGIWGTGVYAYDELDNLTSSTISAGLTARTTVHTFDIATNRLTGIQSPTAAYNFNYEYDKQGNIVQRGAQVYAFDQGNRLKSAAGRATYAYDGLGHRISVVGNDNVNRVQIYSQGGQLLYAGPSGSVGTKYVFLNKHLVAQVSAKGTSYTHTDGLGSPIARTSESGALTCRTKYEPYGLVAVGSTQTIGFTGHVNDIETGLTYMQQRYYDPVAGRFLSIDPVTTDANTGSSFNRYAYAANNPYKYIDPDGRAVETPWDAANVAWGVASLTRNVIIGNYVGAAFDVAGIGYDAVATAVPVLPGGAATIIQATRATSTIRANNAAGAAFQSTVAAKVKTTAADVAEEVTVKTASGVKTRLDILSRDAQGAIACTECKASATAQLTKNQKVAHPEMAQSGAVVVGKGKPGFPGGTIIPPTVVDVVRP